jgi:hypothetical protein
MVGNKHPHHLSESPRGGSLRRPASMTSKAQVDLHQRRSRIARRSACNQAVDFFNLLTSRELLHATWLTPITLAGISLVVSSNSELLAGAFFCHPKSDRAPGSGGSPRDTPLATILGTRADVFCLSRSGLRGASRGEAGHEFVDVALLPADRPLRRRDLFVPLAYSYRCWVRSRLPDQRRRRCSRLPKARTAY